MALNIKDAVTERLEGEVAALTGETKTGAVRAAVEERRERLTSHARSHARGERLRRFLVDEAWPQLPEGTGAAPISKEEREAILGYGPEGARSSTAR